MNWEQLKHSMQGEVYDSETYRRLYATDASVYRVLPEGVAFPANTKDIKLLIEYATTNKCSLIPRAAGTSLAGQCVGAGIVVDVSKHFNKLIELNIEQQWVRVQPGMVRDELNRTLRPHGLFFAPITSTSNRATIGGMVGNNSCGTNSIIYGSTRDHVLELKAILSDGSDCVFGDITASQFQQKCRQNDREGAIYRQLNKLLSDAEIVAQIQSNFPKKTVQRRNTGYALDALLSTDLFSDTEHAFNLSKLLCGSEGTLAFMTEIKLHLSPLPPPYSVVLVPHFKNIENALKAVPLAMTQPAVKCEMMDAILLNCTKEHPQHVQHRFFVEGDPEALLMIEFAATTEASAIKQAETLINLLQQQQLGYAYPVVGHQQQQAVWQLRAAGLGLLANIPGDKKSVTCIEDTAVALEDLVDYMAEFRQMMQQFKQEMVIYAHAGAGELHLRPVLNLKDPADRQDFYEISKAAALLVKKYQGALSGEHGDGRLRAPFIPLVMGETLYDIFKAIKLLWDPQGCFNPGKIVDAPDMTSDLRYVEAADNNLDTAFDFSASGGLLRTVEKCNGSGDCRKSALAGGTMCPSYHATKDEKDSTRARANMLREMLTNSDKKDRLNSPQLWEVMQLCIACKGCAAECPSNIDMAALKATFLEHYYRYNKVPLRTKLFAYNAKINAIATKFPRLYNFVMHQKYLSVLPKYLMGIAPQRRLPLLANESLHAWYLKNTSNPDKIKGSVYLFCDEFSNYLDASIGIQSIQLLRRLGYEVTLLQHRESGRAAISKGMLAYATSVAEGNVAFFDPLVSIDTPLLGIEPSAILTFRDEYPRLVSSQYKAAAERLAPNCLLIDEFIAREIQANNIVAESFTQAKRRLLFHGHCHQKALTDVQASLWCLSLPVNYTVEHIPSGCCGMAGSFGYEKEHYDISMKIGDLVLFPSIKKADADTLIVASGTSCRCQIEDGTGRQALHPVEVLWEALL